MLAVALRNFMGTSLWTDTVTLHFVACGPDADPGSGEASGALGDGARVWHDCHL